MPDPSRLAVFFGAALALLVVPGPAVLYVVTQSIDQGRRAGLASTGGIFSGTLVHVAAGDGGAVRAARVVGSRLRRRQVRGRRLPDRRRAAAARGPGADGAPRTSAGGRKLGQLYRQGIVVNVLNPKTALFFLAFLPQFVDPSRGAAWRQILVLGLLFACLGFLTDGTWALVAGTLGDWLRGNTRYLGIQRIVSGSVFVALGAVAALSAPVKTR